MSEFDDPDLRGQLGRLSGPFPDENAAYATMQRRLVRAKRRRAVAWSGGAAMSVLVVVAAYAAGTRQSDDSLRPATTGGSIDVTAPTTVDSTTSTSSTPTGSTVLVPVSPTSVAPGVTTPSATIPGTTTPRTTGSAATSNPGTSNPGTSPSTNPSVTGPPAPVSSTFNSEGGSITVRLQNGTLSLVKADPSPGFEITEQRDEPDRVDVRFRSDTHSTRIRVLIADGRMSPIVEEEDS